MRTRTNFVVSGIFHVDAGRTTRYSRARTDRFARGSSCPPTRSRLDRDSPSPAPPLSLHGSRSGGTMLPTSHAAVRGRLHAAVRAAVPCAVLIALLGPAAHAQTFFVDAQNGACSNSGPGTEA